MTITRKTVADEIDRLDDEIAELQTDKAEIFASWREHLDGEGLAKTEVAAEVAVLKLAIRRRRELLRDADAVAHKDALLDEILGEIIRARQKNAPPPSPASANGHPDKSASTRACASQTVDQKAGEVAPAIPPFLARNRDNSLPIVA